MILKTYYEQLYAKKIRQSRRNGCISGKPQTTKTGTGKIENLKRPITSEEIQAVIKNLPRHKTTRPDGFPEEFYQMFKEEIIPILLKLFGKIQRDGTLPNFFYEASITLIPKPDKTPPKRRSIDQYP